MLSDVTHVSKDVRSIPTSSATLSARRSNLSSSFRTYGPDVSVFLGDPPLLLRKGTAAAPAPASAAADPKEIIAEMTRAMLEAADRLEFERAAYLRDQIAKLRSDGGDAPGNRELKNKNKKRRKWKCR